MPLRVAAFVALGMLAAGPAAAQSAASRIDQPTPGTLPPGISTVPGKTQGNDGSDSVAPPGELQSSTDVMKSDGSVPGHKSKDLTDPVEHLPNDMR